MNRYSKPSASIELFCLDGEFAGGCNKIQKPFSVEESIFEGGMKILRDEIRRVGLLENDPEWIPLSGAMSVNLVIDGNTDILDYSDLLSHLNDDVFMRGAWDNALVVGENNGAITDNLTSGLCYFTFTAPLNKTFS